MGTARRQYTDEFKREAVGLLVSSGRPLSQIAQELGIAPSRLRAWRNKGDGAHAGSPRRPNRTNDGQDQALQTYRATLREDGNKLCLIPRTRLRIHLDQIRPHGLEATPSYARLKPSISSLYDRCHDPVRLPGILVLHHLAEGRPHDLPGQAELVLQPAALPPFAPLEEPFPDTVQLGLRAATHGQ